MIEERLSGQASHVLCTLSRSTIYGPQSLVAIATYSLLSVKQVQVTLKGLAGQALAEATIADLWRATEQGTALAERIKAFD